MTARESRCRQTRRQTYPGFWHSVLLCVTLLALQTVLTVPFGILDAVWHFKLASNPAVLSMINLLACILILLLASRIGRRPAWDICLVGRIGPRVILAVIVSTAGAGMLLLNVNHVVRAVFPPPEWVVRLLSDLFSWEHPLGSFILLVIVAPVTEELLFRGLILRGLLQRFSVPSAILLSSILFTAIHLNPRQFPSALGLGLLLGFWYARTRSLAPCFIGHGVANAVVFARVMLLKARGDNLAELHRAEFPSAWLLGAGLLLLGAGTWLFLRAAPAVENGPTLVAELPEPVPLDTGAPPIIFPSAEPLSGRACTPAPGLQPSADTSLDLNAPTKRPRKAIASFVLGLMSLMCMGFFAGLPVIVLGYKARRQIRKAPEHYKGRGLALAGMILGCVSVIPTLFVVWVVAAVLLPGSDNPFIVPVQSAVCISNLERIGLGFRTWARAHDGNFPITTLVLESPEVAPDQALQVFRQFGAESLNAGWLICPADPSRHPALDFQNLQATNISYELEIGPEINESNPHHVLARCPIHGHELLCDGSVRTNVYHLPHRAR